MDRISAEERSRVMSRIRGKDTGPERTVRQWIWRAGYRYRLYVKGMTGRPDIVMRRWGVVVDVRGCFWHRHEGCREATMPKSHEGFWAEKFRRNVERDGRNVAAWVKEGWKVLVVWACFLKEAGAEERLVERLGRLIAGRRRTAELGGRRGGRRGRAGGGGMGRGGYGTGMEEAGMAQVAERGGGYGGG